MSQTEVVGANERVRRYWLSLNEFEKPESSAASTRGEFWDPPQLALDAEAAKLGMSRRSFLKLMGASAAMASFAGCTRRPVQTIVPYVSKPVEITHGIPNHYASNDPVTGMGLVLITREGRPIKVDGNDDHPMNGHGLMARGQAEIFDLYDPDRLRGPKIGSESASWDAFDATTAPLVGARRGVAFFTGTIHSPTLLAAIRKFSERHYQFDALPFDDIREGQKDSFGKAVLPRFRFHKAKMIVSIDGDFLDTMISPEEFTRQFSAARSLEGASYNRFVAFESSVRLTGMNADQRYAIEPSDRLHLALALAAEVARKIGRPTPELDGFSAQSLSGRIGIEAATLLDIAEGLAKNRGRSLVIAGGVGGKSASAVALQNVVNFLNSVLGNDGVTIDGTNGTSNLFQGSLAQVQELVAAMNSGAIETLVIQGVNPAYHLPASVGFAAALKKVKNVIYFSRYADETAVSAQYLVAESHPFETWGDVNPLVDLYGVVQPTIRPLFETRSLLDQLAAWGSKANLALGGANAYELVRETWKGLHTKYRGANDFEDFWEQNLQKGYFDGMGTEARDRAGSSRSFSMGAIARSIREAMSERPSGSEGTFSLIIQPSMTMGDGSQSNNSHLHELPDPVTKATWGNHLLISPAAAAALKLQDGEVVRVENSAHAIELPVIRQPGLRDNVAVVNYGYGRKMGGRIGDGLGVSVTGFTQPVNGILSFLAANVKVAKTGRFEMLAVTQEHSSLEGRDILFETTFDEFKANPAAGIVHHIENPQSLWSGHKYEGYRWGMTIDLNRCTGCSACVMACVVENNIPIVGKEQVNRGREMHWIRIDRYYSGDAKNPEATFQPMTCQHCENAPCETVCPVLATVHDSEGLNVMVYNRCVGTRYCSNNCPYKVRRFNFLEFNVPMNGTFEHPIALSKNPDVTLRSRGVMEKCTFCVQRIMFGKNEAKREGRKVRDGEIRTACQEACPADVISFGNINDPEAEVSKKRQQKRGFRVLEELNTKPSITYLTRVWNRAPKAENSAHGAAHEGGH